MKRSIESRAEVAEALIRSIHETAKEISYSDSSGWYRLRALINSARKEIDG
jgi:hypothetical protein